MVATVTASNSAARMSDELSTIAGVPAGGAFSGLGTNTKFVSAPGQAESRGPAARSAEARRLIRTQRWVEMLNTGDARHIRDAQLSFLREYLPDGYRTKFCLARLQFGREDVALLVNDKTGKARWHGAAVCGSVWTCPVCAERITGVRRNELKKLLALTKYRVVMVTFTLQHNQGESLAPMVDALNAAARAMKGSRAWGRLAEKWGMVGHVHALETTYGENGWHPHRHEMFILDPEKIGKGQEVKARLENELQAELFELYHSKLLAAGRDCDQEHGVKVSANRKDYGDYISKWGVTEELTRSTNKLASGGGRSVWELLADAIRGDRRSWYLFLEYAAAFKGKKQLHWSKGLRELLQLGAELTDEEAAAEPDPEPVERVVVQLNRWGWFYLLEKDLRVQTVKYCEEVNGDPEKVLDFLARRGIRQFVMAGPAPGP